MALSGDKMSDFVKTILTIIITVVLSSIATTATLTTEIKNLTKLVDKSAAKLDKIDERVRQVEIKQASYIVSNY